MAMDFNKIIDSVASSEPLLPAQVPVVPGRAVHVDADMLCYVAGGGEDMSVATSRQIVHSLVNKFKDAAGAERAVLQMTASGSLKGLRVLVPTSQPYQAQRVGARRPKNWGYLREYLSQYSGDAFRVKLWEDREADDGFGYVSLSRPDDVIVTKDKDMRMLPGWHMDWDSLELVHIANDCYEAIHFGKVYGYKWFLLQMLQGDTADHIRGLGKCKAAPRGCGEATAKKLLADTTCKADGVARVVELYKQAFGERWANEFAEQAMLLWIRRGSQATLDEFRAYTPVPDDDQDALSSAVKAIKLRVREMQLEAEAVSKWQTS